jgi:putative transposase
MKFAYETDLTDAQWTLLEPLLPPVKRLGRPRTPLREIIDAMFYVTKGGCQWRLLPGSFPPWKTVYHYFRCWSRDGLLAVIHEQLRLWVRQAVGKRARASAAIIDSQTVRSDGHGGEVGYDAGKKTKGRKRFLCVDTLGLIMDVTILAADTPERTGAQALLQPMLSRHRGLRTLWADGGFSGPTFADWVKQQHPRLVVDIVKRSDTACGFTVLPKRWIVERTFGWLMRNRRLVRDYEQTPSSACGWILLAMSRLMLRRLA